MLSTRMIVTGLVAAVLTMFAAPPAARAAEGAKKAEGQKPEDQKPAKRKSEAPKISLEEFERRKAEKDAVVLDVRSPEEFAAGHVPGAVNLPVKAKDFDERVAALDKKKTYLVHCAVGVRSEQACKKMSATVDNLFNFAGGMKAWQGAGKPVERK